MKKMYLLVLSCVLLQNFSFLCASEEVEGEDAITTLVSQADQDCGCGKKKK